MRSYPILSIIPYAPHHKEGARRLQFDAWQSAFGDRMQAKEA